MEITDTAKWELKMLAQMGALQKDAVRIIAQKAGIAPQMLEIALQSAANDTITQLEPGFRQLVEDGYAKASRIPPCQIRRTGCRSFCKAGQRQFKYGQILLWGTR